VQSERNCFTEVRYAQLLFAADGWTDHDNVALACLDMSSQPLDDELSGFVYIKEGVPIIGVNALHHPNRQRFTIAHEVAHLQLHRDYITSKVHVDKTFSEVLKRDGSSASGTERLEIEANQFSAALLMPSFMLEELLDDSPIDIEDEDSLEEWARKFRVSKAALQYRLRNFLGRI